MKVTSSPNDRISFLFENNNILRQQPRTYYKHIFQNFVNNNQIAPNYLIPCISIVAYVNT